MSSPSRYPENAATLAMMSSGPVQSVGSDDSNGGIAPDAHHAHHALHHPVQDIPHPTTSSSNTSSTLAAGNPPGTPHSAASLPTPIGTATSSSSPAPAATHGDELSPSLSSSCPTTTIAKDLSINKTTRILPARHRSGGGPSLLTQRLAQARGIPATPKDSQPQPDIKLLSSTTTKPAPISPSNTPPPESSPVSSNSSTPTATPARIDDDGDTVTFTEPLAAMASSATMTATMATAMPILDSISAHPRYDFRTLGNSDALARSHRELLGPGRGRGTSLERTDRERRLHEQHPDLFSNVYTHNPGDTALPRAPLSDDSNGSDQDPNAESRARYRLWRDEHLPEKIWSIGGEESDENQDGQVEKSITEVLAGVEHNPRSRKASHSLRFFKEGLPEDKARRRESRVGAHPTRDKLPVHAEEASSSDTPTVKRGTSPSTTTSTRFPHEPAPGISRASSFPLDLSLSECPRADYINSTWQTRHTPPHSPRIAPADKRSTVARNNGVHDMSDDVGDAAIGEPCVAPAGSTDAEDRCQVDGGDDSGEEKVSSALFVPHQAAENDEVRDPTTPISAHHPHTLVPKSRAHSRVEDYHPWLVRTDEPESDGQATSQSVCAQPVFVLESTRTAVCDRGDDVAVEEEHEIVRPSGQRMSRPSSLVFDDQLHDQMVAKQPVDAIELIPYKHQVGGHTTIWRFSRRAVCKKLNNRENEFYETIERYHRDLLPFLPRYIGVLNVTYQKQPRRKSIVIREEGAAASHKSGNGATAGNGNIPHEGTSSEGHASAVTDKGGPRVISQSLQSTQIQVPTVTFVDNQHILPRHLLQPTSTSPSGLPYSFCGFGRNPLNSNGASQAAIVTANGEHDGSSHEPSFRPDARPLLEDHQVPNSWGATTINKKLRNQVFTDVFMKQPVAVEKHKKGHQRALPRKKLPNGLRSANSDPTMMKTKIRDGEASGFRVVPSPLKSPLPAPDAEPIDASADADVEDVTGTSAPEPEILMENLDRKKRRYSGTGLRRKPTDVSEDRGNLKYFQDPDDTDNRNILTRVSSKEASQVASPLPISREGTPAGHAGASQGPSNVPSAPVSPPLEFKKIPRPPNPKEAQTQKNSRVEYFLLIEDLTSGMKKPCVMDLKMGTRQYGIEATPKKQQSQKRKCAETTSRSLGVRVCGLQVWDVKSRTYIFRDKYFGRGIKAGDEFQQALTRFLYDGVDLQSILRHIPTVLQKLERLEVIVSRLRSYRFYAASLLIYYDGDTSVDGQETNVDDSTTDFATDNEDARARKNTKKRTIDFKIADFANSVIAADSVKNKPCPPRFPNDPDRGFLKGLRSLRRYFLKIQRDVRVQLGLPPFGVTGQPHSTIVDEDEAELSD